MDTKPGPEPKPGFLEKVVQIFQPKPTVAQRGFSELKKICEDEKRKLGDRLIEDFMIKDLEENPKTEEVYEKTLAHFRSCGYISEGIIGRSKLLKNQDGERIGVTVFTGNKYLAAKVEKVVLSH